MAKPVTISEITLTLYDAKDNHIIYQTDSIKKILLPFPVGLLEISPKMTVHSEIPDVNLSSGTVSAFYHNNIERHFKIEKGLLHFGHDIDGEKNNPLYINLQCDDVNLAKI